MTTSATPSSHSRWLQLTAVLMAIGGLGFLVLVALGVFDPKPLGDQSQQWPLEALTLAAGEQSLRFIDATGASLTRSGQTWRLTAAHAGGELDSAYGLVVGEESSSLVVAVSPLGYVAMWEQDEAGEPTALWLPWQTWPHVRPGQAANEIWLDIVPDSEQDRVTVRINRELLWSGLIDPVTGSAGTWAASYGAAATIDFRELERFSSGEPAGD